MVAQYQTTMIHVINISLKRLLVTLLHHFYDRNGDIQPVPASYWAWHWGHSKMGENIRMVHVQMSMILHNYVEERREGKDGKGVSGRWTSGLPTGLMIQSNNAFRQLQMQSY